MQISVLVASFKRPTLLSQCLTALSRQARLPDEVIVITRVGDLETAEMLSTFDNPFPNPATLKIVNVEKPGIVNAENRGLEAATGDIICLIDDDAVALTDWLKQIEFHYQNEMIGAVGGPTVPYVNGEPILEPTTEICHRKTWYGGHIGNSEKIPDSIKEVHVLRGCNMSFRRALAKRFDSHLKPYWRRFEDDMILSIFRQGYRVIYDPQIQVYHHTGPVKDVKTRDSDQETIYGSHHNNTYVMLKHSRLPQQCIFLLFTFLLGDRTNPGLLGYLAKALVKRQFMKNFHELGWALQGKLAGLDTYRLWRHHKN